MATIYDRSIVIRATRAADIPRVLPGCMLATGIVHASEAAALSPSANGWVAEENGRIVGFVIADSGTGSISALVVLDDCQRRGIGLKLLRRAVQWLEKAGVEFIWLSMDPGAPEAAFYLNNGWRVAGTQDGSLRLRLEHGAYRSRWPLIPG